MPEQMIMEYSGQSLRAIGEAQALDHADRVHPGWIIDALSSLREYCYTIKRRGECEFVMENFRRDHPLISPPSPNAWGAFTNVAARLGIIRFTGKYRPAKSERTHGHVVKVWSVV